MSIITGECIRDYVKEGRIVIDPFDPSNVQPNSVDLTLGSEVKVYRGTVTGCLDQWQDGKSPLTSRDVSSQISLSENPPLLDPKQRNAVMTFQMDATGWIVKPGILYLMHTAEVVGSDTLVTQLNGKSSIARLGIIIHFTAAYGDTGFRGQYTLEVAGLHPVVLYPGMKIAQAVFYKVDGRVSQYVGHYTGDAARGAQQSRSWQQF